MKLKTKIEPHHVMFELSFTAFSFAKWSHSAYTVFKFFTVRIYFSVCNIKRNQYIIGLYRGLLLVPTPVYTCWVKCCASFMSSFAKTCAALVLLYYFADTDCSPSPKKKKKKKNGRRISYKAMHNPPAKYGTDHVTFRGMGWVISKIHA